MRYIMENGFYTTIIHGMTPDQVWQAWKNQKLTFGQVYQWQIRHNYYFDSNGNEVKNIAN